MPLKLRRKRILIVIKKFSVLYQIRMVMGNRQLSKSTKIMNILIKNLIVARAQLQPNIKIRRIKTN